RMDDAEHAIAIVDRIDDDAEAIDVRELLEADLLVFHLAPDGVGLLFAPRRLGLDSGIGTFQRDRLANFLNEAAIVLAHLAELFRYGLIGFGVQPAEGMILEFLA